MTMKTSGRNTIRVVLADDHAVVRKGIREYLEDDDAIRVIGEAGDGTEAVALVVRERPDVAVFDIQMPQLNGLEATRQVKQQQPATRVLILTTFEEDDYIFGGLRAGASGFLLKDVPPEELAAFVVPGMFGLSRQEDRSSRTISGRGSGHRCSDSFRACDCTYLWPRYHP